TWRRFSAPDIATALSSHSSSMTSSTTASSPSSSSDLTIINYYQPRPKADQSVMTPPQTPGLKSPTSFGFPSNADDAEGTGQKDSRGHMRRRSLPQPQRRQH